MEKASFKFHSHISASVPVKTLPDRSMNYSFAISIKHSGQMFLPLRFLTPLA